ncbi:MAG: hypothetical protein ACK56F_20325 [bacterium]
MGLVIIAAVLLSALGVGIRACREAEAARRGGRHPACRRRSRVKRDKQGDGLGSSS